MVRQIQPEAGRLPKETRIQVLFEGGIKNCKQIHKRILNKTPCSLRTVQRIVSKIKNGLQLARQERSDKGESALNKIKQQIMKFISQSKYVDCQIIKKRFNLQQTRQNIRKWLLKNNIAEFDHIQRLPPLSEFQKLERVKYCRAHMEDDMALAVFDVEMKIETHTAPKKSWRLTNEQRKRFNLQQTRQNIRKWLLKNNIAEFDHIQRLPPLSEFQKLERVKYCRAHMEDDMALAVFDVEMKIETHTAPKKSWRLTNEQRKSSTKHKFPLNLIYGQQYLYTENMDSNKYNDIIKLYLIPFINSKKLQKQKLVFYSDNDPKHRSKKTTALLEKYKIKRIDWPSYSPDLNPIENIWSILKNKLSKLNIQDENTLKKQVRKIWKDFDQTVISKTILTQRDRCQQIINKNGITINY